MRQSDGRKYTEVTIVSKIHKRCNLTAACKKEVVPVTFKGEKSIQLIVAEYESHPDSTEEAATRSPGILKRLRKNVGIQ